MSRAERKHAKPESSDDSVVLGENESESAENAFNETLKRMLKTPPHSKSGKRTLPPDQSPRENRNQPRDN
jgi:hypothetical protein